jgi:hypothetical protein
MSPCILITLLILATVIRGEEPDSHLCSYNQTIAHTLAKFFVHQNFDTTNCPKGHFLYDLYNEDPSPKKTFVVVGFNKGNDFAEIANIWEPWSEIDEEKWFAAAFTKMGKKDYVVKGMCPVYKPPIDRSVHYLSHSDRSMYIGLELNKFNLFYVHNVLEQLSNSSSSVLAYKDNQGNPLGLIGPIVDPGPSAPNHNKKGKAIKMRLKMLHVAASDISGRVVKTNKCDGTTWEACSIIPDKANINRYDMVETLSIDGLLGLESPSPPLSVAGEVTKSSSKKESSSKRHIDEVKAYFSKHLKVDILKIDAEGHDALVVKGAMKALREKRIRLLIFEYHARCPWPLISLEKVVRDLYERGYDCYYMGTSTGGGLWRLSDTCWDPLYELYKWSNVACVDMQDKWYEAIKNRQVSMHDLRDIPQAYREVTTMEHKYVDKVNKLVNRTAIVEECMKQQ